MLSRHLAIRFGSGCFLDAQVVDGQDPVQRALEGSKTATWCRRDGAELAPMMAREVVFSRFSSTAVANAMCIATAAAFGCRRVVTGRSCECHVAQVASTCRKIYPAAAPAFRGSAAMRHAANVPHADLATEIKRGSMT